MNRILIVGSGNLGVRYVQGLSKVRKALRVDVLDQSEVALENSRQVWSNASTQNKHSYLECFTQLKDIPTKPDIVIVATPSQGRAELTKDIIRELAPTYLLLEKVLCQSIEELAEISVAGANVNAAWVNTPRRAMGWFKEIRRKMHRVGPMHITKKGGLWGLACNSIHFIDLACWLTGRQVVSVDTSQLAKKWFSSKRDGYYEINGTMRVHYSDGTILDLISDFDFDEDRLTIECSNSEVWNIFESKGYTVGPYGQTIEGRLIYQSEITAPIISSIISDGKCDLPGLNESVLQHRPLISSLLNHWNASKGKLDSRVPIT